jgi:hypothetical protein
VAFWNPRRSKFTTTTFFSMSLFHFSFVGILYKQGT